MQDKETWIEVGFGLFAALLLGALAIVLGGQAGGRTQRRRQHAAASPTAGAVPAERQQARGAVSAR